MTFKGKNLLLLLLSHMYSYLFWLWWFCHKFAFITKDAKKIWEMFSWNQPLRTFIRFLVRKVLPQWLHLRKMLSFHELNLYDHSYVSSLVRFYHNIYIFNIYFYSCLFRLWWFCHKVRNYKRCKKYLRSFRELNPYDHSYVSWVGRFDHNDCIQTKCLITKR